METKITREDVTRTYVITYDNGFKCTLQSCNDIINHFQFQSPDTRYRLTYVPMVSELQKTRWGQHDEIVFQQRNNIQEIKDLKFFEEFTDFDNLYYVGSGVDGLLLNNKGAFIPYTDFIDESDMHIYGKFTFNMDDTPYLREIFDNHPAIIKYDFVRIPYYNQAKGDMGNHTLEIKFLVEEPLIEEYLRPLEKPGKRYVGSEVKVEMLCSLLGVKKLSKLLKRKKKNGANNS